MITGFANITHDLNPEEVELIPILIAGFKTHGPSSPIKEPQIRAALWKNRQIKISGARLRKLCNRLRVEGVPIIATSKGYYYSEDPTEIRKQIQSLRERSQAIDGAAKGLEKALRKLNTKHHQNELEYN